MAKRSCRFCGGSDLHRVVDLGMSPLCESYLTVDQLDRMEPFYPLHVWVCESCLLVQLDQYVDATEIFDEYAYFSSYSSAWLEHARRYVADVTDRLALGPDSLVIELASNDGYLLRWFVERGIPCLGVEPAANVAEAATRLGVPTEVRYFGTEAARELATTGRLADLVIGNNVLAQVPDLNDFVAGIPLVLRPTGTVTIEFPHVLRMLSENQFDTIYHEHFCYFSLLSVEAIFEVHGLTVFDVEELWTHGGSLRIYARHAGDETRRVSARVDELRRREQVAGLRQIATYTAFEGQVRATKRRLLELLIDAKDHGRTIVGYGAPGKGNTLLNYCGIREDFLDFTVDRNPYKQGRFLPGTHVPIEPPERLDEARPDLVLVLPWNLIDEITSQLAHVRDWGGRFVVPIPTARVI